MHQSVHSFQACLPPVSHRKEKKKHCVKRYDAVDAVLGCNLGRDIVCYGKQLQVFGLLCIYL